MHELSAVQAVLDKALKQARDRNAARIIELHIAIGELSDFNEDSARRAWQQASKGTIAETARLQFRHVPAELQCMSCFTKYHPETQDILCPHCGAMGAKVLRGEEFSLDTLDVA